MAQHPIIIIGAGPAGLTAGYELQRRGLKATIFERAATVGGLARTELYEGFRFDVGGHRFYTKLSEIQDLWHEILGPDLLTRRRLSRIYYDGQFFHYPLKPLATLAKLGLKESSLILLSYLKWQLVPHPQEDTFEQWVTNRFGQRLYELFFRTYTEKVWGMPCGAIRADWAAQRIRGLSIKSIASNALFGTNGSKSLITSFHYPRLGPGMMWERLANLIVAQGGTVDLESEVLSLEREGTEIKQLTVTHQGQHRKITGGHYISTMPLGQLLVRMHPAPPDEVLLAARQLRYRDFLIVFLILKREHVFPDQWIYIHSQRVKVGRIQNFKNWSPSMVPDPGYTSLGLEYFCSERDPMWSLPVPDLISLAVRELAELRLCAPGDVVDGTVLRQRKAYPVYDQDYQGHLEKIRKFLSHFPNLQTIGRNGLHRYNNQDHSMLTGMLAVRNLLGEVHDLWRTNTQRSYYEEMLVDEGHRFPFPSVALTQVTE